METPPPLANIHPLPFPSNWVLGIESIQLFFMRLTGLPWCLIVLQQRCHTPSTNPALVRSSGIFSALLSSWCYVTPQISLKNFFFFLVLPRKQTEQHLKETNTKPWGQSEIRVPIKRGMQPNSVQLRYY